MATSPSSYKLQPFLCASKPAQPTNYFSPLSFPSKLKTKAAAALSLSIQTREGLLPIVPQKSNPSFELLPVVYPSLAFANTLFFKSGYNVQVIVGENEPEEKLVSRFRREVLRAGIIQECKRRKFFESKREERKRKTRNAARRNRKRRPQAKAPQQDREGGTRKKEDDEDDNWDFIDVELPYVGSN